MSPATTRVDRSEKHTRSSEMFVVRVVPELVQVRGSVRPQIVVDRDLASAAGPPLSAGQGGPLEYRHLDGPGVRPALDDVVHGVREEQSGRTSSDDLHAGASRGGERLFRELERITIVPRSGSVENFLTAIRSGSQDRSVSCGDARRASDAARRSSIPLLPIVIVGVTPVSLRALVVFYVCSSELLQ